MKNKVLAITGIRSEYDILLPVLRALAKDPHFSVSLVVCGAHLSAWHGNTLKIIEKDKIHITDKIDYLRMSSKNTQRPEGVGILTNALSRIADREKPDFLLVVGDREEAIATAIVGNYLNILTAHIGGGDSVFGNADDPIRFAISKLSHVHFVTSKKSADNLINVGEEKFRIFDVGNPALDNILSTPYLSVEKLATLLNFDIEPNKYILLIKHPLSSEKENICRQIKVTLEALKNFCEKNNFKVIGIYPNTDPGSKEIVNIFEKYKNQEFIKFFKTLPRELFVNIARHARVLVGNSSMGILEAPFYKLPVINIGNRQKGRAQAGNVEFVKYRIKDIVSALSKACFSEKYRFKIRELNNPFGNGHAAKRIAKILKSISPKDKKWLIKENLC